MALPRAYGASGPAYCARLFLLFLAQAPLSLVLCMGVWLYDRGAAEKKRQPDVHLRQPYQLAEKSTYVRFF
jgi:hypothetical protein